MYTKWPEISLLETQLVISRKIENSYSFKTQERKNLISSLKLLQ